ncbi:hypothetical protein FBU59_000219 [Linderina macrospora]|uniref:Uncharacterized protein n=1 Tax=Linderina macrospora TaxID=4868 RepID=A0ACC1JHF5_9FUNG|nr:hypothetical protein FBU59_000219 [Linderina macrospora]
MSTVSSQRSQRSHTRRQTSISSSAKSAGTDLHRPTAPQQVQVLEGTTIPEHSLLRLSGDESAVNARARSGSDDDVTISLGLKEGIERAWNAVLANVGNISLAWQNEVPYNGYSPSAAPDPSQIFENVQAKGARTHTVSVQTGDSELKMPGSHPRRQRIKAIVRPRSHTTGSHVSSSRSVRSDDVAVVASSKMEQRPDDILKSLTNDGGFSDHAEETRRGREKRKEKKRKSRSRTRTRETRVGEGTTEMSVATESVDESAVAEGSQAAVGKTKPGRRSSMSIRLSISRLLPPKIPGVNTAGDPATQPKERSVPLPNRKSKNKRASWAPHSFTSPLQISVPLPEDSEATTESDTAPAHRRTNSLPYENTLGILDEEAEGAQSPADGQPEGSAETAPSVVHPPPSDTPAQQTLASEEVRLNNLEDRVSMMLSQLGMEAAPLHAFDARQSGASSAAVYIASTDQRKMHWFQSPRYAPAHRETKSGKDVILVDDDSSGADNLGDADYYSMHRSLRPLGSDSIMPEYTISGSNARLHRKLTTASVVSTAVGSTSSTLQDTAVASPRVPRTHRQLPQHRTPGFSPAYNSHLTAIPGTASDVPVCPYCRSLNTPCNQLHTILERLDQTDVYVKNVARHATAVDALLADLRAQSRVLAETLASSQARASSLSQTVTDAIDYASQNLRRRSAPHATAPQTVSVRGPESVSTTRSRLDNYRTLSKKARDLDLRSQLMATVVETRAHQEEHGRSFRVGTDKSAHLYSWIQDAVAISAHATSASESEFPDSQLRRRRTVATPDEVAIDRSVPMSPKEPASSRASTGSRVNRKPKRGGTKHHRQHHRPVQPIPVRAQRISEQWEQLQTLMGEMLPDCQSDKTAAVDTVYDRELATGIAADGLKLVQRVLKSTIESLDKVKVQGNPATVPISDHIDIPAM